MPAPKLHSDYLGDISWNGTSISGHHPDNIEEFWSAWFNSGPPLGHTQAMRDIWYEHGINKDSCGAFKALASLALTMTFDPCCQGTRGNVDGDPEDVVDISDLSAIIDYLFFGGCVSDCFAEDDVDASGSLDIGDLQLMIDYVFFSGSAPSCPPFAGD